MLKDDKRDYKVEGDEQLKVEKKKGIVLEDSLNEVVDAIIENRKFIIKHEVALKKKKPRKSAA